MFDLQVGFSSPAQSGIMKDLGLSVAGVSLIFYTKCYIAHMLIYMFGYHICGVKLMMCLEFQ